MTTTMPEEAAGEDPRDTPAVVLTAHPCARCGDPLVRWQSREDPSQQGGGGTVVVLLAEGAVEVVPHTCPYGRSASGDFEDERAAAEWLAKVCGSPRYGPQGYGYMALVEYPANAVHAAKLAATALASDRAALERLSEARRVLGITA